MQMRSLGRARVCTQRSRRRGKMGHHLRHAHRECDSGGRQGTTGPKAKDGQGHRHSPSPTGEERDWDKHPCLSAYPDPVLQPHGDDPAARPRSSQLQPGASIDSPDLNNEGCAPGLWALGLRGFQTSLLPLYPTPAPKQQVLGTSGHRCITCSLCDTGHHPRETPTSHGQSSRKNWTP